MRLLAAGLVCALLAGCVVAGPLNTGNLAFDVTSFNGQLRVTEVPYEP